MSRDHPKEMPVMVHPAQDKALSEAERQHTISLIRSHGAGINYALGVGEETAIQQGVPPTIRYRAMFWSTLHRTAMNASHYLAMVKTDEGEAATAAQQLADELRDLILKQLPNSRESIAKIESKQP